MEKYGFFYISMNAIILYGIVCMNFFFFMDFCMEKSNHKPIFLMNLGLKEPYLVYWWCLAILD